MNEDRIRYCAGMRRNWPPVEMGEIKCDVLLYS